MILVHEFIDLQVHAWLSNAVGDADMNHLEHATSNEEYVVKVCATFFLTFHQETCAKEWLIWMGLVAFGGWCFSFFFFFKDLFFTSSLDFPRIMFWCFMNQSFLLYFYYLP